MAGDEKQIGANEQRRFWINSGIFSSFLNKGGNTRLLISQLELSSVAILEYWDVEFLILDTNALKK